MIRLYEVAMPYCEYHEEGRHRPLVSWSHSLFPLPINAGGARKKGSRKLRYEEFAAGYVGDRITVAYSMLHLVLLVFLGPSQQVF
jgi:hypothetical protein